MPAKKLNKPTEQPLAMPRPPMPMAVVWLLCAYVLVMPLAEMALRAGVDMTRDRSRFTVVNAITLTGFQLTIATNTYPLGGRIVLLALTLAGMLFTLIVGGMAAVRILRLGYSDRQIARAAAIFCAIGAVVGAIPLIATGREPLEAFMLSASALGNSGLYFGQLPGLMGWQTHLVLLPLGIIGGLGLPVIMELYDASRRRRTLCLHSQVVIALTALIYLGVFAASFLLQLIDGGIYGWGDLARTAGSSSVAAVNSRTIGFPLQFAQEMPRGMQWIVLLAMIIGGSPAGTAGGLKTTTLAELARGVIGAFRGRSVGRTFALAATWLWVYLGLAVLCLILLLAAVPQVPADRLLFQTVSALSNVGLSHEVVMIVGAGLDILTVAMLLGKLAPLAILWWMAQTTDHADLAIG